MLILGSLLALVCGLANSAAAALEKREGIRAAGAGGGLRLLVALARRSWWLLAMALSLLAWCAEALALALAPVPLVTTLRSAGRGGLVFAGHRWLGERFGAVELAGVGLLAAGGILTASSIASTRADALPISNLTEVLVAVVTAAVAAVFSRSRSGLALGTVVGILFVATGVFTKEIGDRIVREGGAAILPLLQTPGPWLMIALSVWAILLLQKAFLRANAATVSSATTTVSANGLIVAGVLVYHQPLAAGSMLAPLAIGLALSASGAVAMAVAAQRKRGVAAAPAVERAACERAAAERPAERRAVASTSGRAVRARA